MKKNSLIILFLSLLISLEISANTYVGYTTGAVGRNNNFRLGSQTSQGLAIRLSGEKLQLLKGQTISGLRVAFGSKNSTGGEAELFVSKTLGGEAVTKQTITIASVNKMNDYAFSSPYTITGDEGELYLGYTLQIAAQYGPLSADFTRDTQNVSFALGTDGWKDIYGKNYGCANIEAVIDAELNYADLTLKSFSNDGYLKEKTPYDYSLQVVNTGTTTFSSLTAKVTIGDDTESFNFDCSIAPHTTYNIDLQGITSKSYGDRQVSIEVVPTGGDNDADMSDNSTTWAAYFYPETMEKNVLLEVFTGQTCTNCPNGHSSLATALQNTGVKAVEVAHHSGYVPDIFSMNEDWDIVTLYNSSTYAPAAMMNRSILGGNTAPVFECWSVSADAEALNAAYATKPYVSIDLESTFDPSTRQVDLTAKFYTHTQVPGDELRYTLYLVQDNIVASQSGGGSSYVHNAVSRGCLTEGSWGEAVTLTPGETTTITKSFILPESITSTYYQKDDGKNVIPVVLEDMKIVAFVHQYDAKNINYNKVFNAAEVKVGENYKQGGFPDETVENRGARLLKRETYYGDAQGVEDLNAPTRMVDYMYDCDNKLVRAIETSKETGSDAWGLTHYYKYRYDRRKNLVQSCSLQYGTFDYGDMGFFAANDTISYEYDGKNQLVKEIHPLSYYTYAYDEQGRRTERSKWNINSITKYASNDLVEQYSDFNAFDKPCTITATSPSGKSWNEYNGVLTYDALGNLIEEHHYSAEEPEKLTYSEYWVYDGDMLVEHRLPTVFDDGFEVDNEKEVFTLVDGNMDTIKREILLSDGLGGWTATLGGTTRISEYDYYDGEKYAPVLAVSLAKSGVNCVDVKFEMGSEQSYNGEAVDIYRNGIKIVNQQVITPAASTSGNGSRVFAYEDKDVPNGSYEYLVVMGKNSSDVASIKLNTELPAVKDVHVSATRLDLWGNNFATISWTNPEGRENLGFVRNNLMLANMQTSEATTEDANVTSFEMELGAETQAEAYIQTVYKYGKVNSESIKIDTIDAVESVLDDRNTKVKFVNNVLTLSNNADVEVFAANGMLVKRVGSSRSVDFTAMPTGCYLVKICIGGMSQIVKVKR